MKKTKIVLTTILLAASTWLAKAQTACTADPCSPAPLACEYVCNGGFNINNAAPTDFTQVGGFQEISHACGWSNVFSGTTADYFLSTAPSNVDIPCNLNGTENFQFDDGYAGVYGHTGSGGWKEAIQTNLLTNLPSGDYEISFYISLADKMQYNIQNRFGVEFPSYSSPMYINTSSVTSYGWTKFTIPYSTAGGEGVLRIGFLSDPVAGDLVSANTTGTLCTGTVAVSATSYYYIDNVSIRKVEQIDVTSSAIAGCTGESFTLTASNANTYTYTPSVGSPTVGNPLVVTPSSTTIYTVTGTNSGGCVMTPTTITIAPYACCANPAANNITLRDVVLVTYSASPPPGVIQWSSLTSGGFYTGTICAPALVSGVSKITNTLTIVNTLSISTPVTFSNCNVVICEDDIIKQYSTTTIDHSLLKGDVTTLWKGIESSAGITIKNSWIEDAYIALVFGGNNYPSANIENVLFNKNYLSIFGISGTMNPTDLSVKGCIFSSRSFGTPNYLTTTRYTSLFPNIPAKAPTKIKGSTTFGITNNTIRSNGGVYFFAFNSNTTPDYLTLGAVTTGTPPNSDYTNYFDGMNFGIYNYESKVSIINNVFANIATTGLGTAIGAVVHDDGSNNPSITKTEVGRSGSSNYKNFFGYPVYSSSMLDGVVATGGGTLNVSYNEFRTFSRYGVSVKSWYAGTAANEPVTVAYNSYTNTAYAFYGYDNNSIEATVSTNTLVHTASTYTAYTNVYLDEINKPTTAIYHVYNNNFTGSLRGVYALNTRGTRIISNDITINKPGTGVFNSDISLDNSDYCVVAQNTVDCSPTNSGSWYTYGILSNASANNVYKCNIISKVGNCLKFQYTCPSSTIYKNTLNLDNTDPCLLGLYLLSCSSIGHVGFPTGGGYGHSDDIWGDFSSADTYCQASSNTGYDKIYYDGTQPAATHQPQVNLNTNLGLDVSQSYVPTTTNVANTDPCNEAARISITSGRGKNVDGNTGEINNGNSLSVSNYQTSDLGKGRKRILMSADNKSGQRSGSSNAARFYEVDSLFMVYAQTKNLSILNSAKSINSSVSTANTVEQNQKDFNAIHATYLEGDSLVTAGQIEDLKIMAYLCPETNGLAVYQARGLMRNWDDSTEYYNECERTIPDIANAEVYQRLLNDNKNNPVSAKPINLYPNPSNGKLIVENSPENSIFELYDIVGRKVYSNTLNGNATQLDISSFNNGTYIYRITQNGKAVKEDKLILNK